MRSIAVAENQFLVYEGENNRGYGWLPPPVLSIATIVVNGECRTISASNLSSANLIFREDSFDPVTRVRRGRLYQASSQRPDEWRVQKHPAYIEEVGIEIDYQGFLKKRVYGFDAWDEVGLMRNPTNTRLLTLGTRDAFSVWRIVDVERIITGEYLVTLRASNSLGVLPVLEREAIPSSERFKVIEVIDRLTDEAYRSGPGSIVDRPRDAAAWCIGTWLAEESDDKQMLHKDLGDLLIKLRNTAKIERKMLLESVAEGIRLLHARGKPNEQELRNLRSITEEDAEYALAAIGMLLRELRWAN